MTLAYPKPTPKPKRTHRERSGYVDMQYLAFVKQLPCAIGFHHADGTCGGAIEAHHTICGRYGRGKTPDREAIPLCQNHHRYSPVAIHEGKAEWVEVYGKDTDYIDWTLDMIDQGKATQ